MRCPSTSDLVQAHSNRAYDKMEVISDHIHEIMELYEWIFNLREYLASKLAMYVSLQKDEFIQGQKSLLKTLRVPSLRLASIVENLTDEGNISIGTYNNDPALLITFAQEIDDDTVVGTVAMAINRATETPYFAIPATKGDEDTSAVRVDYLNQVIATLGSGSDALAQRVKALEDKMDIVYPFDTEPTENSEKGVTSGGVFDAIQSAINGIDFPETVFPVATTEQKGIMQVGNYLTVNNGLVGVDADALATYIRSQLNIDSSLSGGLLTYTSVTGAAYLGYNHSNPDGGWFDSSNLNPDVSDLVDTSDTTQAFLASNSGNGNAYLVPKVNTSATATIGSTEVKCTNLSTGASNYYIPVRTVIICAERDVKLPGYSNGLEILDTYAIKCWFRNKDYMLTAADKLEVNDQANAFIATRLYSENTEGLTVISGGSGTGTYTLGDDIYYDTGALS